MVFWRERVSRVEELGKKKKKVERVFFDFRFSSFFSLRLFDFFKESFFLLFLPSPHQDVVDHRRGLAAGAHKRDPGRAAEEWDHRVSAERRERETKSEKKKQKETSSSSIRFFVSTSIAFCWRFGFETLLFRNAARFGQRGDTPLSSHANKRIQLGEQGDEKRAPKKSSPSFFPSIDHRQGAPSLLSSTSQPSSTSSSSFKKKTTTSVDSRKIKNPTLRSVFEGAVDLGADAAGKAEKFWETISK